MTIRYVVTRADLWAVNFHVLLRNRFLWAVFALAGLFISYTNLQSPAVREHGMGYKVVFCLVTIGFLLAVIFGFTMLLVGARILLSKHKGVLGEHRLTVNDDGLVESTLHNESLNRWSAYHRTVSTKRYLMLYVTEGQIHVVSKKRPLLEGDLGVFEATVRAKAGAFAA